MTTPGEVPFDPFGEERQNSVKLQGEAVDDLDQAVQAAWDNANHDGTGQIYFVTLTGQIVTIRKIETEVPIEEASKPRKFDGLLKIAKIFTHKHEERESPVRVEYDITVTSATQPNATTSIFLKSPFANQSAIASVTQVIHTGAGGTDWYQTPEGHIATRGGSVYGYDIVYHFPDLENSEASAAEATACIATGVQVSTDALLESHQMQALSQIFGPEAVSLHMRTALPLMDAFDLDLESIQTMAASAQMANIADPHHDPDLAVRTVWIGPGLNRDGSVNTLVQMQNGVVVNINATYKNGTVVRCSVNYTRSRPSGVASRDRLPVDLSPDRRRELHAAIAQQLVSDNLLF
jgi:hypothetical protein